MRQKTSFVLTALAFITLGMCVTSGQTNDPPPNIIIIYADDMGYHGPSCYGNSYHETPNIDALAASGLRFTDAYCGGPVCAPSRAVLMSGQYVSRHGIYRVNQVDNDHASARRTVPPKNITELPLNLETVADRMRAAGYETVYSGKWHLGKERFTQYLPNRRGFDHALTTVHPSGDHRYFYPNFSTIPEKHYRQGTYLTDVVTEFATNYLQRVHTAPFFMYLPYFNVHGPHEAKPEKINYFRKKDPSRPHEEAVYAAMHAHLDDAVGSIRDVLKQEGLLQNTLIIFTSDNGSIERFPHELRGGKQYLYEGGIRIPMIANWPGHIAPGTQTAKPVHQVDLFPTCLELGRGTPPADQILDGVSIVPLLMGMEQEELNNRALFWHYPTYMIYNPRMGRYKVTPSSAIRKGKWKVVNYFTKDHPESKQIELYDLDADMTESENLAEKYPQVARELMTELENWRNETEAPMPH